MTECESHPDIWQNPSRGKTDIDKARIAVENDRHERLYRAVREVLSKSFGVDGLPDEPKAFVEMTNKDDERRMFVSIYGLLLADNWTDPSLGRTQPIEGEEVIKYKRKRDLYEPGAPGTVEVPIVIAGKFADAVVDAVQEYTRNIALFTKVYNLMRDNTEPAPRGSRGGSARSA